MTQREAPPILVVEDSDDDYEATHRALSKSGGLANPCLRFECGEDALTYLLEAVETRNSRRVHLPELILLDLNLPGAGGAATLTRIKQHPELKKIPVVVLTTSDDSDDIDRCYSAGANSYIVKPVSLEQFFATIQQLRQYWLDLAIPPEGIR